MNSFSEPVAVITWTLVTSHQVNWGDSDVRQTQTESGSTLGNRNVLRDDQWPWMTRITKCEGSCQNKFNSLIQTDTRFVYCFAHQIRWKSICLGTYTVPMKIKSELKSKRKLNVHGNAIALDTHSMLHYWVDSSGKVTGRDITLGPALVFYLLWIGSEFNYEWNTFNPGPTLPRSFNHWYICTLGVSYE